MEGSKSSLTEKDALDIAWKYFLQHAQQRISYFNFASSAESVAEGF